MIKFVRFSLRICIHAKWCKMGFIHEQSVHVDEVKLRLEGWRLMSRVAAAVTDQRTGVGVT